jgi:hypothetical protein
MKYDLPVSAANQFAVTEAKIGYEVTPRISGSIGSRAIIVLLSYVRMHARTIRFQTDGHVEGISYNGLSHQCVSVMSRMDRAGNKPKER